MAANNMDAAANSRRVFMAFSLLAFLRSAKYSREPERSARKRSGLSNADLFAEACASSRVLHSRAAERLILCYKLIRAVQVKVSIMCSHRGGQTSEGSSAWVVL